MKVRHSTLDQSVVHEVQTPVSFYLTNRQGGYLSLSDTPQSRYEGLHFFENKAMYKTIANIKPATAGPVTELINNLTDIERLRGNISEKFLLVPGINGLMYDLSHQRKLDLTLDCKNSYDGDEFGRHYTVTRESEHVLVHFQKKHVPDSDPGSAEKIEYELYLAFWFKNESDFSVTDKWLSEHYPFDKVREPNHASRYVYQPFSVKAKQILVGLGTSKEAAEYELARLKNSTENQNQESKIYPLTLRKLTRGKLPEKAAFLCAQNALEELTLPDGHLFAGLPWFFQRWTRDEAISIGAIIKLKKYAHAKKMLYEMLDTASSDGRIPNRIGLAGDAEIASADGVWWVLVRLHELIQAVQKDDHLYEFFEFSELVHLKDEVHEIIANLIEHHSAQGFEANEALSTWMDTAAEGIDDRAGVRIEMQALRLRGIECLRDLCDLTGDEQTKKSAEKTLQTLQKRVQKMFLKGKVLCDGLGDPTIRSNIFIAAYVYPALFKKTEWKTIFQKALPDLWAPWGGLASIEINHELFCDQHTGINNHSYHRGDVWYWVNNIAALVLMEYPSLKKYAEKMLDASTYELLWSGAVGSSAEISSFKQLESNGCLNQAWSNATYIELLLKKYRPQKS